MTQLNAVLSWGGGPGLVNRATSPSNAAMIYQDYYERPANLAASLPLRMASANAVYQEMGWGGGGGRAGVASRYDSGGWLPPGMPFNTTGRPEAVLTPDESRALITMARRAEASGGIPCQPPIQIIYNGTQHPTVEQKAVMMRDLTLAMSGATP